MEILSWLEVVARRGPFIGLVECGYRRVKYRPNVQPSQFEARCNMCGQEKNFSDIDRYPTCFEKMKFDGITPGQGERIHHYVCPNGHHSSGCT